MRVLVALELVVGLVVVLVQPGVLVELVVALVVLVVVLDEQLVDEHVVSGVVADRPVVAAVSVGMHRATGVTNLFGTASRGKVIDNHKNET